MECAYHTVLLLVRRKIRLWLCIYTSFTKPFTNTRPTGNERNHEFATMPNYISHVIARRRHSLFKRYASARNKIISKLVRVNACFSILQHSSFLSFAVCVPIAIILVCHRRTNKKKNKNLPAPFHTLRAISIYNMRKAP